MMSWTPKFSITSTKTIVCRFPPEKWRKSCSIPFRTSAMYSAWKMGFLWLNFFWNSGCVRLPSSWKTAPVPLLRRRFPPDFRIPIIFRCCSGRSTVFPPADTKKRKDRSCFSKYAFDRFHFTIIISKINAFSDGKSWFSDDSIHRLTEPGNVISRKKRTARNMISVRPFLRNPPYLGRSVFSVIFEKKLQSAQSANIGVER